MSTGKLRSYTRNSYRGSKEDVKRRLGDLLHDQAVDDEQDVKRLIGIYKLFDYCDDVRLSADDMRLLHDYECLQ